MPLIVPPGTIPAHVQRMMEEADQLAQRLAALEDFTETPAFKGLHLFDQHLLQAQGTAMQTYLRILAMRIDRARATKH